MRVPAERRDKVLLKTADDKSKRLALLEDLQRSPLLDARQKKWLREELMRLRKGIQGEKDSAYFLDQYFKGGENHVVLHDLRFVVDGDVAQIDHLVINRGIGMYLLETKNYAGSLSINEQGEFTVQYDECRFGIPSPIEQSHRHERILRRLLEKLEIGNRTGELDVYHVVMVHPKAVIQRPPQKSFDTSHVIKADQFPSWHKQFVDKEFGVTKAIKLAANLRSLDTIKEWGEKLKRQHRPANLLELPSFMQPKEAPPAVQPRDIAPARSVTPMAPPPAAVSEPPAKRLICGQCGAKISYPEGKFCWNNSARFGGNQYCRTHQALFPA
jgi:hypothetical protein